METVRGTSGETVEGGLLDTDPIEGNMWPVCNKIINAYPNSLSVDEIVSAVDLSETEVRHALVDLQAREKIASRSVESTTKYTMTAEKFE